MVLLLPTRDDGDASCASDDKVLDNNSQTADERQTATEIYEATSGGGLPHTKDTVQMLCGKLSYTLRPKNHVINM